MTTSGEDDMATDTVGEGEIGLRRIVCSRIVSVVGRSQALVGG
jgi:hypothetical protein